MSWTIILWIVMTGVVYIGMGIVISYVWFLFLIRFIEDDGETVNWKDVPSFIELTLLWGPYLILFLLRTIGILARSIIWRFTRKA